MYHKKLAALVNRLLRSPGLLVVMAFLIDGCSTLQKQIRPGWSTQEISPGVRLSHQYFHSLFHAPENINILDVDLHDTAITIQIAYNDSLLESVSEFGKASHAVAAVNGNFFNTHIGGSVCFLKVDGRVINRTHDELDGTLFLPWLDTAAMAISGNKVAVIISRQISAGSHTTIPFLPLSRQGHYWCGKAKCYPSGPTNSITRAIAEPASGFRNLITFL